MDPSRAKSNGGNDSERKFVVQILWLSLAGGAASFTRVSNATNCFRHNIVDNDSQIFVVDTCCNSNNSSIEPSTYVTIAIFFDRHGF